MSACILAKLRSDQWPREELSGKPEVIKSVHIRKKFFKSGVTLLNGCGLI